MLVCRRWRAIMLSIPGIDFQLRIQRSTQKKDVEAVTQRRSSLLDVIVDMNNERNGSHFSTRNFYASFMAAALVASRWRSLDLVSFPPPGKYKDLEITQPLHRLQYLKLRPGCRLNNFLRPFMTALTTTPTLNLTVLEVADPDASLYLVQPACLHVFSSLTVLRLICRRMDNPVDILPCLHRLVTFEAHHLHLPIYPLETGLPLIQTLQFLHLKSVSIQWMASQIFSSLQRCLIKFPHHIDALALQPVILPSCSDFTYDSNDLGPISHFYLPLLTSLGVTSGQWSRWRGNLQLANVQPVVLATAQSLTCLYLQVQCSEQLLANMLGLVPALEILWLGLASPYVISKAFFKAFVSKDPTSCTRLRRLTQAAAPLCTGLRRLHLHYKRWLRGLEKPAIVQVFGDIVASHQPKEGSNFSLLLSFDVGPRGQAWKVHEPAERYRWRSGYISIGFPSPHGMITLSTAPGDDDFLTPLSKGSKYLEISKYPSHYLRINFLFSFDNLEELRIPDMGSNVQTKKQLPFHFPFFHTLKVLHVPWVQPWLMRGRTFHKLERYREFALNPGINLSQSILTEMPICTRLDLHLSSLTTFRLPQVRELAVRFDRSNGVMIWEKQVAVNSNLSGLKLLSILDLYSSVGGGLIQILKYLPALETLILRTYKASLDADFFKLFVPMSVQAGLDQSGRNTSISVLCPRLESLQIENVDLTKHLELIPVLKSIVTMHAVVQSPLKSFTFCYPLRKFELIGRDGSFTMEEIGPAGWFSFDT